MLLCCSFSKRSEEEHWDSSVVGSNRIVYGVRRLSLREDELSAVPAVPQDSEGLMMIIIRSGPFMQAGPSKISYISQ